MKILQSKSQNFGPTLAQERGRIERAGGRVELHGPCWRIDGGLNLSRALGDFLYKVRQLLTALAEGDGHEGTRTDKKLGISYSESSSAFELYISFQPFILAETEMTPPYRSCRGKERLDGGPTEGVGAWDSMQFCIHSRVILYGTASMALNRAPTIESFLCSTYQCIHTIYIYILYAYTIIYIYTSYRCCMQRSLAVMASMRLCASCER